MFPCHPVKTSFRLGKSADSSMSFCAHTLLAVIPQLSFSITVNNLTGMRMIPNLICSLVLSEFGLEAPPGMVGNINRATLDTLLLARDHGV